MSTPHGEQVRQMLAEAAANLLCQKPQPSDTPETDRQGFTVLRLGKDIQAVPADFARELERQRDAAREDARRLAALLKEHDQFRRKTENQSHSKEGYREFPICKETREALAAHEALTAKN